MDLDELSVGGHSQRKNCQKENAAMPTKIKPQTGVSFENSTTAQSRHTAMTATLRQTGKKNSIWSSKNFKVSPVSGYRGTLVSSVRKLYSTTIDELPHFKQSHPKNLPRQPFPAHQPSCPEALPQTLHHARQCPRFYLYSIR